MVIKYGEAKWEERELVLFMMTKEISQGHRLPSTKSRVAVWVRTETQIVAGETELAFSLHKLRTQR